jgi:hypothetical protein
VLKPFRYDIPAMSRILLALLVVGIPVTASAQMPLAAPAATSIEEVRTSGRAHFGPVYLAPGIQLKELGWDSNVFNQGEDQKSDFTVNLSPKVDVWIPMATRALFTTKAAADLIWYAKYDSERSVDPQISGRAEAYLHRLTLFTEGAFVRTRQRFNDEIDVRAARAETSASAGVQYRVTPKFSVEAAGRRGLTQFDAEATFLGSSLQQRLNRTTTAAAVTARHRFTPLTMVAVKAETFDDRFPLEPLRDSHSVRVMPGIEFKPKALIGGSAYVGYRRFDPRHGGSLQSFSGLVANLKLSYTLLGSTMFAVSYSRDLTYSFEQLQPYFIANAVGGSIRRALGRRFDAMVGLDRSRSVYSYVPPVGPVEAEAVSRERLDTSWNYAATIGYRVGHEGRIGFGASYWTRESTTATYRNSDGLRIGTTVTYGF